ncbi:C-X-C chemokine receptor type 3-like [Acipenser ruthenus]|uniref:C-X-C chemokine receptor type 3-like n=1 Tax=Acipenser ruthenus TaxID=7906 RepID=UPI002741FE9B|nr:C-X-C chemokine receptor type 3-like [Acipenser ruthenus]
MLNETALESWPYWQCFPWSFRSVFHPLLYSLIFVLGLLGNGLVIAVLLQLKRARNVTDTFILHLALADSLLVITLPFWAAEAIHGWVFGTGLCKFAGFTLKVNFYCGIFFLCCISFDRYLTIVRAVQVSSQRKTMVVRASCVIVWALSILISFPDLIFLKEKKFKNISTCFDSSTIPWQLILSFRLITRFIFPSTVMIFCYSEILHKLRWSQELQKRKAMKVIQAVVVVFFVCWTPYNVVILVDMFLHEGFLESGDRQRCYLFVARILSLNLGSLHCCLNPILYTFVGDKFRKNLFQLIRSWVFNIQRKARPRDSQGRFLGSVDTFATVNTTRM